MKVITISTRSLLAKAHVFLIALLIFTSACSDPSEIGLVLEPGSNQIGVFYEEIPLSPYLVLADSFNTTSQGRLLVGGDQSEFFGTTQAIGYSRLSFNPNGIPPRPEALFDSAVFTMNVVDLIGEDFDEEKAFQVHRLTEPILDTAYYNFNHLSFEEDNTIASGSFLLAPDTVNQLRMEVSPDLSAELFGKLTTDDPVFDDIFAFRDYFPGIAITGDPEQNASLSLATGSGTGMILYYHYDGDTVSTAYPINTIQSRHFNGILSDRQGSAIGSVVERGEAYDVPGDRVGTKAGLGLMLKLDMSPLHGFLDTLENITFNQIMLEVGPVEEYPEFKAPYNPLVMYFATEDNEIYRRFDGAEVAIQAEGQGHTGLDPEGNVVPTTNNQTGLIYNTEDRVYANQITSYVNAIYRSGLVRTDLFLYPNVPSTERAPVTSDAFKRSLREFKLAKDNIKLKVYYTRVR
ncbi:DUF4270 family protein [Cyclobacterium jeungdonense]|uniref:DUF4270 family protein n=1 Tax=Cyclobacterium jeungdonense TaxID=708087 RepID=A0ABT8CBG7_9BACT|nr:DUF4270 family protein [Cyclobacterium jeungdonense]MDN3689732.1 DUF4270 family protein [Cyclobacterium jeungdonense]